MPNKSAARRARLAELAAIPGTLVFFESARRVAETLSDCAAVLGAREAAVARELTKHFESVKRGPLPDLAREIGEGEPLRGEIVVLVGPPGDDAAEVSDASLDERLRAAMMKNSVKDAAAIVAGETGQPRRRVYARALQLAGEREG